MINLVQTAYFLVALLIAIDVHECCHALVALQLGDPTAKYRGRVSLNPIVHLDPLGTIMMLFMAISGVGLGWGKPVPVNPNNLRNGPIVGETMVSAAGPLSNLLTAAVTAIPLRLVINGFIPRSALSTNLGQFLIILFTVSISLAIFNLLPIFPLDGYHFWLGLLHEVPSRLTRQLWIALSGGAFMTYGPLILLALVFIGPGILGRILFPVTNVMSQFLLGTRLYY
jgi:Zn-dependent protease